MIKFYFLSGWIENLGVVPLLRSAAFLSLPMFFFLLARLFLVTRVFETITQLLLNLRSILLPPSNEFVKVFLLSGLFLHLATSIQAQSSPDHELFLLSGQHYEIPLQKHQSFTVTRSDVLAHTHRKDQKRLLVRAERPGSGEVIIWNDSRRTSYRIHVFASALGQDALEAAQALWSMGLTVRSFGPIMKISGKIEHLSHYQMVKRLQHNHQQSFQTNKLKLHPDLAKKILTKTYAYYFLHANHSLSCDLYDIHIKCLYDATDPPSPNVVTYLENKYFIDFASRKRNRERHQNYRAYLKIIQEERLDGQEISFGLDRLHSQVSDLFTYGLRQLIDHNQVLLQENNLEVSTLARPEILLRPKHPATISIGSDIPYQTQDQYGVGQTQWRFAGLKVELALNVQGEFFDLQYDIEFSHPNSQSGSISGSRESAHIIIKEGEAIQLFQIRYQALASHQQNIPGIGNIPLLGRIFSSSNHHRTYKRLTGHLIIKKERP